MYCDIPAVDIGLNIISKEVLFMKSRKLTKSKILLLIITAIISVSGIVFSFIQPTKIYADSNASLPGRLTREGYYFICLCPVPYEMANCSCPNN